MNNTMTTVIQCILLIPTIATIGTFWFLVFANIADGILKTKPTDKEIEDKMK